MSLIQTGEFQPSGLECARGASGFEHEELAELTGIDKRRLARFETGVDYPTNEELSVLAEALNVMPKFFNQAWVKAPEHAYNY